MAAMTAPTLFLACKSRPVEVAPPPLAPQAPTAPISRNVIGVWEGTDKGGTTYSFWFASESRWESHTVRHGAKVPLCRGTYNFTGSTFDLRVLEEVDPVTLEWRPETGTYPRTIAGSFVGGRIRIPALSEADLVKKY